MGAERDEKVPEENVEDFVVSALRPELNYICSNPIRACIIHMLVKNKDLNHTIRVEEIAHKLGKRHSVVIYHLERLMDWKIVKIVKSVKYGDAGEKRSIWGLNLDYPNLVREVYTHILKVFYTQKELDKMCSVNRNIRYDSVKTK
jgi:DNA-binding transcriptional ArsR family regulator